MITKARDAYDRLPDMLWAIGIILVGVSPAIVGIAVLVVLSHKA